MSTEFSGRSVIITGGGKGIGRETARKFLEAGADVTITGRDKDALEKAVKKLSAEIPGAGDHLLAIPADVSEEEDCRRTIDEVISRFNRIDILINNAGMSARGVFADTEIELYRKLTGINFLGPVMMSRLALAEIRKNRGSIVFISTLAALMGLPGLSHYGSSKLPLTALSQALRGELKKDGVHIGLVYVGFTENDSSKTIYDATGRKVPLQDRKNSLTQAQVASSVFSMVCRRKRTITLSGIGKLAAAAYRYLPRISENLTAFGTMRSSRYGDH